MTRATSQITKQPDDPLAIASMVCGVLSLSGPGLVLGVPAVILGIIAIKRHQHGHGLSIAGIVTGSISTLISIVFIAFVIWALLSGVWADSSSSPNIHPGISHTFHSL